MSQILYGDIGGTKTLMTLAEVNDGGCRTVAQQRFPSAQFPTFEQVLQAFYAQTGLGESAVQAACFGVAGPVSHSADGDQARVTNLPWQLNASHLEGRFNIKKIRLINDFEAVGYGIPTLAENDLSTLQGGQAVDKANRLAIGAGTGLGVAMMVWCNGRYQVVPTEGGHIDFPPTSELQCELYHFLARQHGRVSCEYVLSGPGLVNIFRFLHDHHGHDPAILDDLQAQQDAGAAIAAAADRGDALAQQSMTLFVEIYGALAGNYALTAMARGGVYIAGGIAGKILSRLASGQFLDQFRNKGKMAELMATLPVHVVLDSKVGLHGARQTAMESITI